MGLIFNLIRHLLWLHSLVCIQPGRKPRRPFFFRTRLTGRQPRIPPPHPGHSLVKVFLQEFFLFIEEWLPIELRHEKTNILVSDQVRHKPGHTTTEDGKRLEISDLESRWIVLCSENKGADQLRGYREADLRLCFRICKMLVFS